MKLIIKNYGRIVREADTQRTSIAPFGATQVLKMKINIWHFIRHVVNHRSSTIITTYFEKSKYNNERCKMSLKV